MYFFLEKIIANRALAAEKATVELINKYVTDAVIGPLNSKGLRQFQLPPDEITQENKRKEEPMPIDKYDWISFEKVFRPIAIPPDSERSYHCEFQTLKSKVQTIKKV